MTELASIPLHDPQRNEVLLGDVLSDRTVFVLVRYFG